MVKIFLFFIAGGLRMKYPRQNIQNIQIYFRQLSRRKTPVKRVDQCRHICLEAEGCLVSLLSSLTSALSVGCMQDQFKIHLP